MFNTGSNIESLPDKFGTSFDVVCKDETLDAKAFLYNIEFSYFKNVYTNANLTQCSSNRVFVPHSGATDLTGSHHLFNTTCTDCEMNGFALFTASKEKNLGWFGGCGVMLCTGFNNYIIHDHDGTFLPQKGVLLANNSWVGDG